MTVLSRGTVGLKDGLNVALCAFLFCPGISMFKMDFFFFSQSGVAKPTYDPNMWLWLIKNFGYILNSHTSMEKQGKPFSYALGNAVILNFSCQNQNWKNTHSLTTYQIKIAPVSSNVWMYECWRSMSEQTHSYALELSQFHFLCGVVLLHLWNENLAAMCVTGSLLWSIS